MKNASADAVSDWQEFCPIGAQERLRVSQSEADKWDLFFSAFSGGLQKVRETGQNLCHVRGFQDREGPASRGRGRETETFDLSHTLLMQYYRNTQKNKNTHQHRHPPPKKQNKAQQNPTEHHYPPFMSCSAVTSQPNFQRCCNVAEGIS